MNWFYIVEHPLNLQAASRTHVLGFCHALAKIDRLTLISQANSSSFEEDLKFTHKQIKPSELRLNNLSYLLNTIKAFFFLRHLTDNEMPDVFYLRAVAFGIGPLILARLRNIPSILEINGNWDDEHRIALESLSFPKKQLISFINTIRGYSLVLACRIANILVVVTPNLVTFLLDKGIGPENKILVVPNGVNVDHFSPQSQNISKQNLGLNPDINYIGYVGSLASWQGIEDLIAGYSNISKDLQEKFHLIIVGGGPELDRYKRISNNFNLDTFIHFTGPKPHSSIPQYLNACSLLVAPKKYLSSGYSPLKIFEYLACARPILASYIDGLEFISQQEIGMSFSAGDVIDLSEKLKTLLEFPEDKKMEMGMRGRQYVVSHHSWDQIVNKIRQLFLSYSIEKK